MSSERSLKKISNWQIETPEGFCDFSGVSKTSGKKIFRICLENGQELTCSLNHPVKTTDGFTEALNIKTGDLVISKGGPSKVWWTDVIDEEVELFDILEVRNSDHSYFTNNIVSHNCAFLGSSGTLIGGDTLKNLVAQVPVAQEDSLKVYEKPIKGHQYVITADVSEGKGLDYSAFNVIDITKMPYKQVCVFRSNLYVPSEYADVLIKIGMRYNEAQILVENNNSMGNEINNLLFERGYENIIYTENGGLKGKRVSNNPTKGERGLRTTASTKAKGCSVLKLLIEGQQLIINDHDTIWELSRFSRKGRSYEAEEGATDDIVMSLVVFAWLTTDDFFINLADINTVSELRDMSEAELEEKIGFLGFNGLVDYDEPEVYVPAEYFY